MRSSLVNNRTQAVVCDDLGMTEYVFVNPKCAYNLGMKHKERADLLEGEFFQQFVSYVTMAARRGHISYLLTSNMSLSGMRQS